MSQTRVAGTVSDASFPNARAFLASSTAVSGVNVGTVVSPGSVSLELSATPEASTLTLLPPAADSGCTFTGTAPASPVRVAVWDSIAVFSSGDDPLGLITEVLSAGQPGAGDRVVRVYSDSAVTVQGTVGCAGVDPVTYDLKLNPGWNAVEQVTSTGATRLSTLPTTARSELRGQLATPSVTLTLGSPRLEFATTDPVSVSASFNQVGGYSGRIHLSTDLPGLSVQPATITLPPLGLQLAPTSPGTPADGTLTAQQISSRLTFRYTPTTNIDQTFTVILKDDAGREVGRATSAIQVTRPGFTLSTRTQELELAAGSSVQVPVCVSSEGNYQGAVTLSASSLPAGVSVKSTTVTLDGFTCGLVTLSSTSGVLGGTSTIALTGAGGSFKARIMATLTTLGSAVSVTLTTPTVTVYQGLDATLTATVTSEYGFRGPTTLTLGGLPSGVSAAPVTAMVPAGASTTASFTLHASTTATLGVASLTVTSPHLLMSTVDDTTTLRVRPPHTPVTDGALLTPSPVGVWQRTGLATSPARSTLTRTGLTGGALAVTLAGSIDQLVSTDAGVLALSFPGTTGTRVQDDGRVTPLPSLPFTPNDDLATSTDINGLLWFTRTAPGDSAQICTWNPTTGEVRIVDRTGITSSYGTRVTLSADRRTVMILPRYSGQALTVATATGSVTSHSRVGGFSSAAVTSTGDVWFASYNTLSRVTASGTTEFNNLTTGQLIGFDATVPNILWGRDASTVYRIDTTNGTSKAIELSDTSALRAVLNPGGGLYVISYEQALTGPNQAFLSEVR
ncbi:hypothetical protein E7T09_04780 [Deinococcus sp. KSM4-11]|uniref:hypothetical protein n=1 Tax=Deinococcus sp. KSM4-11 TaxID=2568654 RepID=UPI0010A311BC|nr:hypothetical protein [Deinococcus sp. KSM4-11]THF88522.1 hypothetical protein E7T09_04780 [Deinococcus sp. KSM4-11]